jgi:hypothetical protein
MACKIDHQAFLRNDQRIAVAQENPPLAFAVLSCKGDILHDDVVRFDPEPLAPIGAAKGAFVVRTAHRHLQQNRVGLAGGPDDITFVMHENLLRFRDDRTALIFYGEDQVRRRLSYAELYAEVSRLAAALKAEGVTPGDRVVGFMPNMPETIAAMLAAASLGATWSSCSPDFGIKGVLDRFGQIRPRVLFTADGYSSRGELRLARTRRRRSSGAPVH